MTDNHYATAQGRIAQAIYALFLIGAVLSVVISLGCLGLGAYRFATLPDYSDKISELRAFENEPAYADVQHMGVLEFEEKYGMEPNTYRSRAYDLRQKADGYEDVQRDDLDTAKVTLVGFPAFLVISLILFGIGWSIRWLITGRSDRKIV